MNTPEDIENRYTSLRLGRRARLFFKDMEGPESAYFSEYIMEFNWLEDLLHDKNLCLSGLFSAIKFSS